VNHALQAEHSKEIEALAGKEQQRRLRKQAKAGQVEDSVSTCSVPSRDWRRRLDPFAEH